MSIAVPAMVVGVAFGALIAGGEFAPSERAIELDEMLAESPPDVVILGNSIAHTAIDVEELQRLLDQVEVASAHMKNSRQPGWYAILDNRVFGGGHRPKLVVVVDGAALFDTAPTTETAEQELLGQMDADDALILRKTFGERHNTPLSRRLQRGRGAARAWVVDNLKWYSVGLLWAPDGQGTLASRGRDEADASLEGVFGVDGSEVDFDLYRRVLPVVELVPEEVEPEPVDPAAVAEETYFSDLARLAAAHNANFVVVRVPAAPSNAWADSAVNVGEPQLITLLNEGGAGYIDLSDMPVTEKDFADPVHFSDTGRVKMTRAIASALIELGALGDEPIVPAELPARMVGARRTGALRGPYPTGMLKIHIDPGRDCAAFVMAPEWGELSTTAVKEVGPHLFSPLLLLQGGVPLKAITRVRDGCDEAAFHGQRGFSFSPRGKGPPVPEDLEVAYSPAFPLLNDLNVNAYWVYPNTQAELVVAAPEGWSGGEVEVAMWLDLFGNDDVPILRVGGRSSQFEVVRGLAQTRLTFETDDPEWTLTLESARAHAAIRTLSVTTEGDTTYVIGASNLEAGSPVRLIGAKGLFQSEGNFPLLYDLEPTLLADGTGVFDIQGFDYLGPGPLSERGLYGNMVRCSPLRVVRNGVPIPETPVVCGLEASGEHEVCVGENNDLRFSTRDATNEDRWQLGLTDTRECGNLRWLYPGDVLTTTLDNPRQRVGADRLSLGAATVGPGNARVKVVLSADGDTFVDEFVPMHLFQDGDVLWDLGRRIPAETSIIELRLSSRDHAAMFLVHVAVLEQLRPFEVFDDDDLPHWQLLTTGSEDG